MRVKPAALELLTSPPAVACSRLLLERRGTILMLHRFAVPELGVEGHPRESVRGFLAYLREHRFELIPLREMMARLQGEGPLPRGAISFTIDDGYFDHAAVGGPIFAEFDCPVTTFVTTGFLDGRIWFWWDRIEYIFHESRRSSVTVELSGQRVTYSLAREVDRQAARTDFTTRCKEVSDEEKLDAILAMAAAAEVELPATPPTRYAPMSWDQLRACEERGMSFGPHTLTHPILRRTTDAQSREEVTGSWARLREECREPVPVFCYPNGRAGVDFGSREIDTLQKMSMVGAVTGVEGYAETLGSVEWPEGPFLVKRFPFHESLRHSVQYVGGLERVKQMVRRVIR